MSVVAGLDVGGTKTHGVLVDGAGHVLAEARVPTGEGPGGVLATIQSVVEQLEATGGGVRVTSLGLGVPGLVDVHRGAVRHAGNLGIGAQWFPLRDRLQSRFAVPVTLENDVNVAALGAAVVCGFRDVVYLSIGTGLAAGVVIGGALRRGSFGAAGEIGHLAFDPEGAVCHCGQRGCLETVASGGALASTWPPTQGEAPARAVLRAVESGDRAAATLWSHFIDGLAACVKALCLAIDPEVLVLGGGVADLGPDLSRPLVRRLHQDARRSPFLRTLDLPKRIHLLPTDEPVAALGAAQLGVRDA